MTKHMHNPPLVAQVRDLKVHFQSKRGIVHAVDGVSFDIRKGETLGIVGETGSGKSVTGRSFLKLLPIPPAILAGGDVTFYPQNGCTSCLGAGCASCASMPSAGAGQNGVDVLNMDAVQLRKLRGDRVAMIFQDPGKALNPTLTIGVQLSEVFAQHRSAEILALAGLPENQTGLMRRFAQQNTGFWGNLVLSLPGNSRKKARILAATSAMVERALADTQVPNPAKLMDRYPHELSGGMRQRVMIAQALACSPDLLIADEPTTALDVTVEARILELIRQMQVEKHTSVLYISHDLSLVRQICDRVAVMYAGRVVEMGTTDEIFANPSHPYTQGLMKAVPNAQSPRGALSAISGTVPELVNPPKACRFAGRCAKAFGTCQSDDPVLENITDTHQVACFLHKSANEGNVPERKEVAS